MAGGCEKLWPHLHGLESCCPPHGLNVRMFILLVQLREPGESLAERCVALVESRPERMCYR